MATNTEQLVKLTDPFIEKHSVKTKLCRLVLTLFATFLQCFLCACGSEADTKIDLVANSIPPVFSFKGNGNISRFVIYGPLVGNYTNEDDRPVLWQIFPDRDSASKLISNLSPIKYGEVPKGWTQYAPENGLIPSLVEGSSYRVVANVNSANSGYIDITVRNGKVQVMR